MSGSFSPAASLTSYLNDLRASNPFLSNRVDRPLTGELVDVSAIHELEFRRLTLLAQQARETQRGIGAVVWGEAGLGKTHLLARLLRWSQTAKPLACVVYLHNFQVQPGQAGVSLLQGVLSFLTASRGLAWTQTRLFRLLNSVLARAQQSKSGSWDQFRSAYQAWISYLASRDPSQGVLLDRACADALFRFYQAAHAAGRNLGDPGPVEPLRWLGAAVGNDPTGWEGPGTERPLLDNLHAKKVLSLLCLLAWSVEQPFLLCLDQVDNLEEEQIRSLSRFLHDLLDSAGNLLVVTTGVRETLFGFQKRGVITETSWDRIGQFAFPLGRINLAQARALLLQRLHPLQQLGASLPEMAEVLERDPLFPLGEAWFQQRVGRHAEVRPRDLLGWAGERWQQVQEGLATTNEAEWLASWHTEPPVIPESNGEAPGGLEQQVIQWLAEARQQRRSHPELQTPNEDRLAELTSRLLELCADAGLLAGTVQVQRIQATSSQQRPALDLIIRQRWPQGAESKTGIRFLVSHDAKTTNAAYRKLLGEAGNVDQLILVTDVRSEPPVGSKGQKQLNDLLELPGGKFLRLNLSEEEILELDAVQVVLERASRSLPPGTATTAQVLAVLAEQPSVGGQRLLKLFRTAAMEPATETASRV